MPIFFSALSMLKSTYPYASIIRQGLYSDLCPLVILVRSFDSKPTGVLALIIYTVVSLPPWNAVVLTTVSSEMFEALKFCGL